MSFGGLGSFSNGHNNLIEKGRYVHLRERNKIEGTEFLESNAMKMVDSTVSNNNLPKNNSIYTNFLKNNVPSKFNINNVEFAYDKEDNQKICIFEVVNLSAEEISDLGFEDSRRSL